MQSLQSNGGATGGASPGTPSPTFERILTEGRLSRRARQDRAVTIAHDAVKNGRRVVVQAPTGVGKSYVALATAADAGRPGAPGIVATTMNNLGDQYLRDCRQAAERAGFTYTRVMGAAHYACADSLAGRAANVPGFAELEYDQETRTDNSAELRAEREAWLRGLRKPGATYDPTSQWELKALDRDRDYACPGYPDCGGNQLGGCGSKAARARSFQVQVVITNFHMLAYTHKTGIPLIPLEDASVVIVDEAHELPDKIAEIDGGKITERTGSRAFHAYPELAKACERMVRASLDRAPWPHPCTQWDTETGVPVDLDGLAAFTSAWAALPPEAREALKEDKATEDGEFSAGDVLALLRAWCGAAQPQGYSTWKAWTSRTCTDTRSMAWSYDRVIHLRRVDAAAEIVPAMLPAAAVLLTGTVGDTLAARLGLADAEVHDLGQEFDWTKVRGRISRHDGAKNRPFEQRKVRDQERLRELAGAIRTHGGALVLANAATDARFIAGQLDRLLPGHRVFVPATGGSDEAERVKLAFVAHRDRGGKAVLVGVDSYTTGLDLPGELCTFVGWWVCVKSASGYYDNAVSIHFSMHGDYLEERFRARFAQGIGRLLRTPTDYGEVMVCDNRAGRHLNGGLGRIDQHLRNIQWGAA